jgi:hypothetical protein
MARNLAPVVRHRERVSTRRRVNRCVLGMSIGWARQCPRAAARSKDRFARHSDWMLPFEPLACRRGSVNVQAYQEEQSGSTKDAWFGDGSWSGRRRNASRCGSRRFRLQGVLVRLGTQHRRDCRPTGIHVSHPRLCTVPWDVGPRLWLLTAFDFTLPPRPQPPCQHRDHDQ